MLALQLKLHWWLVCIRSFSYTICIIKILIKCYFSWQFSALYHSMTVIYLFTCFCRQTFPHLHLFFVSNHASLCVGSYTSLIVCITHILKLRNSSAELITAFENSHKCIVLVSTGIELFSSECLGWCHVLHVGEKQRW